jgi:Papain family cysteine protease
MFVSDNSVKSYQQSTCPASGSKNTRYGSIKGYGYSTSKCVCYTDGSGCSCDRQNEGKAVRNVATYGPAVVCLDAATWQDYTDGIITSASGCSQDFMNVNHCVQAVGYAYVGESDGSKDNSKDNKNDNGGKRLLKSNDNSKSGSNDKEQRQGYWIVRNQWSSYWGMNGYAYVAMGENTCGILNDMLQAYT